MFMYSCRGVCGGCVNVPLYCCLVFCCVAPIQQITIIHCILICYMEIRCAKCVMCAVSVRLDKQVCFEKEINKLEKKGRCRFRLYEFIGGGCWNETIELFEPSHCAAIGLLCLLNFWLSTGGETCVQLIRIDVILIFRHFVFRFLVKDFNRLLLGSKKKINWPIVLFATPFAPIQQQTVAYIFKILLKSDTIEIIDPSPGTPRLNQNRFALALGDLVLPYVTHSLSIVQISVQFTFSLARWRNTMFANQLKNNGRWCCG